MLFNIYHILTTNSYRCDYMRPKILNKAAQKKKKKEKTIDKKETLLSLYNHLQGCEGFPPCQGGRVPRSWNGPFDIFLQH